VSDEEEEDSDDGAGAPLLPGGALALDEHQSSRSEPAVNWRTPTAMNGGMVSTAKRMARYVEPQTRWMARKAKTTRISGL